MAPQSRGCQYDTVKLGPLSLVQVMDRDKHMHTEYPDTAWAEWKATHPEVFGDAA